MSCGVCNKEMLTVKEVAELLKGSEIWVRKMVGKNKIPSYKVGGKRLFKRKEIEKWIKRGEKE